MAMEDLLRIAERTEDLPDQALAQIAASGGGIESVIAASEMKARNDIRQDAQMMQQQAQPPVVDQLINMAMRQPMPPMGAAMPPQMQQPMGQPMPPQMGMQQPMPQPAPQPTPPQMAPDMAQLAQQMGVPAMNTGGLIRRFQTGTQGTVGPSNLDLFLAQLQAEGIDPLSVSDEFTGLAIDRPDLIGRSFAGQFGGTKSEQQSRSQPSIMALTAAANIAQDEAQKQAAERDRRLGNAPQAFDSLQSQLKGTGIDLSNPLVRPSTASTEVQPTQTDQSLIADQQAPAQVQDNEQTDTKKPPLRGLTGNQMLSLSYQGPEFLQGSSPTGLDPRLGAFTTGSGPASSTTSKVTQNLNNELMQGLIDKVNAYDTTIDDATAKMKTLEADLPTRENIKDRIKEQTRLGMAKSFFDAAGSGSPDFLTALAQGMGGAAGVMNKMTGEEQKELHQHALQMFQLEREKANTANARQEKALTRLQAARQYEQTRQIADRDNYVKLLQFQRDYNNDQFEINKANADFRESFRDALAQSQKDFDTQTNLHTNTDQQFLADSDQLDMKIAVDSFGRRGVPAAQRLERKAVKTLIRDMNAEAKNLTDEQRQLPLAQQEGIIAANLRNRYEEDKLVGLEAALDQHGKYLRSVFGSRGTDRYDSAVERYLQEFPHLNSNLFTENVAPIY
mgnify:CR=1 FL=1